MLITGVELNVLVISGSESHLALLGRLQHSRPGAGGPGPLDFEVVSLLYSAFTGVTMSPFMVCCATGRFDCNASSHDDTNRGGWAEAGNLVLICLPTQAQKFACDISSETSLACVVLCGLETVRIFPGLPSVSSH